MTEHQAAKNQSPLSHTLPEEGVASATPVGLFAATLFVSASLLFWIQPLFAKMVLPLLGGSPSVWNTALVFFQAVLLAGYGYAHLLIRQCGQRSQVVLHLGVLAVAALALPVGVAHGWRPDAGTPPTLWLLGLLGGLNRRTLLCRIGDRPPCSSAGFRIPAIPTPTIPTSCTARVTWAVFSPCWRFRSCSNRYSAAAPRLLPGPLVLPFWRLASPGAVTCCGGALSTSWPRPKQERARTGRSA